MDPFAAGGLRQAEAIHLPELRDTIAVIEGTRIPFRMTVPEMELVHPGIFSLSMPLTLGGSDDRTPFVPFDGPRVIDPDDLAFVGIAGGIQLFAARMEAPRKLTETLLDVPGRSLDRILLHAPEYSAYFDGIDILYAPISQVGCIFQPFANYDALADRVMLSYAEVRIRYVPPGPEVFLLPLEVADQHPTQLEDYSFLRQWLLGSTEHGEVQARRLKGSYVVLLRIGATELTRETLVLARDTILRFAREIR